MSRTVYIFSFNSEHTTARYFERAIGKLYEWQCVYLDGLFDPEILSPDDIFYYVDPAPAWPLGIENFPCLTIAYLIDVHQDLQSRLQVSQFFDAVFIAQKEYVPSFRKIGHPNAFWLPLACDAEIHKFASHARPYEVGFVGNLGMVGAKRYNILSAVLPKYKTNNYRKYYAPREMATVYSQSMIVFNASINNDVNMRVFEAMAAGAMLVTDRIGNGLSDLFEEDTHFAGYSSVAEAIEKIRYFLAHSEDRIRIAQNGQLSVLSHHTYSQRWEIIWQQSQSTFGQAPARRFSRKSLGELYASVFLSLRQPWRFSHVCRRYGMSGMLIKQWTKAWGRWLNAHIPITPNAIKFRLLRH